MDTYTGAEAGTEIEAVTEIEAETDTVAESDIPVVFSSYSLSVTTTIPLHTNLKKLNTYFYLELILSSSPLLSLLFQS